MIPFARGLSVFFQFSPGRTTLHWTLTWYLRLSVASVLWFQAFSQLLAPLVSSLKVYRRIQQVWHFCGSMAMLLSMKIKPCCTFHFSNSTSLPLQRVLMHSRDSSTRDCRDVYRIRETFWVAGVFQAQSTSLWPLVRFHQGFFDPHCCSGAISTRLHMSLINLIPSGNSLDTWSWHCCLLTLLFTFLTACVSVAYIHAICLWKLSKDGLYELYFGNWNIVLSQ